MAFWKDFLAMMTRNPHELPPPPRPMLTPEIVEAAITTAGRAEVFARARENGWGDGAAPMWVWYQLAQQIIIEAQEKPYNPLPQ